MNNFLKVSLLAAAVAVSLTACQKDEKTAANTAEVKAEAKPVLELPSPPMLVLPNVFPPPACPNELPVVEPKLGAMPLFAAVVAPPPVPPNKPPNTPAK